MLNVKNGAPTAVIKDGDSVIRDRFQNAQVCGLFSDIFHAEGGNDCIGTDEDKYSQKTHLEYSHKVDGVKNITQHIRKYGIGSCKQHSHQRQDRNRDGNARQNRRDIVLFAGFCLFLGIKITAHVFKGAQRAGACRPDHFRKCAKIFRQIPSSVKVDRVYHQSKRQ